MVYFRFFAKQDKTSRSILKFCANTTYEPTKQEVSS